MASFDRRHWDRARARSAALAAEWQASSVMQALRIAFDAVAARDADVALDRALALLGDIGWAAELTDAMLAGLDADPFAEPPFRVHRDRARLGAVLFDSPAARVTAGLVSAEALAPTPPTTLVASGYVTVTRYVRASGAVLRRWDVDALDADLDARHAAPAMEVVPLRPADGAVVIHDGRREGHVIARADADMVTLTAILQAGAAPVMREYRVADGHFLRAASNDDGASRTAMLLTLLRVAGRTDAAPAFDAATRDPSFGLRWSAMREWLALDADAALPRLTQMASDDPNEEVRNAAAATLWLARRRRVA